MPVCVIVGLERAGRIVPICRSRRADVVRQAANAALDEVRGVAAAESEGTLAALIWQEADRLEQALATLGITTSEVERAEERSDSPTANVEKRPASGPPDHQEP